jgi:hypothetical protein
MRWVKNCFLVEVEWMNESSRKGSRGATKSSLFNTAVRALQRTPRDCAGVVLVTDNIIAMFTFLAKHNVLISAS